jgi:Tfp pilus assembly protein PilN
MIHINLLSAWLARKKAVSFGRDLSLALLFAVTLGGLVCTHVTLGNHLRTGIAAVQSAKTNLSRIDQVRQDMQQYQQTLEILRNRNAALDGLETTRLKAPRLLKSVIDVTPENQVWFESLQTRDNTVEIKGVAMNEHAVAQFMSRLGHASFFDEIRLKTLVEKRNDSKLPLKGFHLEFKLRTPAS